MQFEERKFTLKDGRECILRPTVPDDALDMIEYLKLTSAETPFLLRYPDEWTLSEEKEREILGNLLENERGIMMVAVVDGKVAGNCSLNAIGYARRVLHRSSLAIAIKKEYWNLGIGHAMIDYLTDLGKEIGYEQIELDVVASNTKAKALYEKCGFVETGKRTRALKYDDGSYQDEYVMVKIL